MDMERCHVNVSAHAIGNEKEQEALSDYETANNQQPYVFVRFALAHLMMIPRVF